MSLEIGVGRRETEINLPYFKMVCHRLISYILTQVEKI